MAYGQTTLRSLIMTPDAISEAGYGALSEQLPHKSAKITYTSQLIGRFGNQLFQYAALRAEAERDGVPFITPPWIGDKLFNLPKYEAQGEVNTLPGYRQDQASLIYTRRQVRAWFTFRPEIEAQLTDIHGVRVAAHLRVGDYLGIGYPVVSQESYTAACAKYGHGEGMFFVSEENPSEPITGLPEWLPDFVRLMRAKVLFRGNSSFSWWAATLGDGKVYSPLIDGLGAGVHHGVEFVTGNHPRFCSLYFVTDLHLMP